MRIYFSMRHLFFVLIFLLTSISSAWAQLKCGAILPLSGPMASVGNSIKNSLILAKQTLDKANRISFIFEDDQFVPKNTVSAASKLIKQDQVKCMVLFGSSTSLAAIQVTEQAQILTIAIAISPKVVEGKKFVLRHYIPVSLQVDKMIEESKTRNYKKVAILSTVQDAALALQDEFKRKFSGTIVLEQQFLPTDTDFRTIATKIAQLKPDAIMLNLLPPQTSAGAKQLRAAGVKVDLFSGPFLGNTHEVQAANGTLENAWFVTNDDSQASKYYEDYHKAFSHLPEIEGTNGFDVAKLLLEASADLEPNRYLHNIKKFNGILGSYGVQDSVFLVPAGLRTVSAQNFVRLEHVK